MGSSEKRAVRRRDVGDQALLESLIAGHDIETVFHFSGSTIVSESLAIPLEYYRNNTANSRSLIESAIKGGVRHLIFSSTCAIYGNTSRVVVHEDDLTSPMSPYAYSKLMTEIM